jgi:choline dehydrogenase-like flavoprotein
MDSSCPVPEFFHPPYGIPVKCGPAQEHLRELGIPVALNLPGVGANLHDHPVCPVVYQSAQPLPPAMSNHGELFGLLHSQFSTGTPDLQIIFIDIPVPGPGHTAPAQGYTIRASLMSPFSRGTLRLASADPSAPPASRATLDKARHSPRGAAPRFSQALT